MRPDDQRFRNFSKHLTALDPTLFEFCERYGFAVAPNAARQPCRDLRRGRNPACLIHVGLDRNWLEADLGADMEHTVTAISDYYPPDDPAFGWRKSETIVASIKFSKLLVELDEMLEHANRLQIEWRPSVIMQTGEKLENLRHTFRDQLQDFGE